MTAATFLGMAKFPRQRQWGFVLPLPSTQSHIFFVFKAVDPSGLKGCIIEFTAGSHAVVSPALGLTCAWRMMAG
jgi:hypothetical protein